MLLKLTLKLKEHWGLVFSKKVGLHIDKKNFDQKRTTELIPPKTRKIKYKGAVPTRISRRQGGNDSEVIKLSGNNRSTKALIRGDMAGRIKSSDSNWEYFVTSNKATLHDPELPAEIIERNKHVFTNVEEVGEKQIIGDILEPEVDGALESYHI